MAAICRCFCIVSALEALALAPIWLLIVVQLWARAGAEPEMRIRPHIEGNIQRNDMRQAHLPPGCGIEADAGRQGVI
ncbi:hypothetical protein ASB65_07250 [Agrobacterium tumefaciens str. B6]|nr:hypothetical protein ASB65_07250 [Agrobacterium tumefaciens str. B6]